MFFTVYGTDAQRSILFEHEMAVTSSFIRGTVASLGRFGTHYAANGNLMVMVFDSLLK